MTCLKFMEKTFTGGCQTTKFVNIFSLKSFLLHSNYSVNFSFIESVMNSIVQNKAESDSQRKGHKINIGYHQQGTSSKGTVTVNSGMTVITMCTL